mmetsp:Transcript_4695/g.29629  ORF Transcript_4695/g.29629 Transcript_4695/m.29629 type:complete len:85 (+) Transcript_4695:259-513(+)
MDMVMLGQCSCSCSRSIELTVKEIYGFVRNTMGGVKLSKKIGVRQGRSKYFSWGVVFSEHRLWQHRAMCCAVVQLSFFLFLLKM